MKKLIFSSLFAVLMLSVCSNSFASYKQQKPVIDVNIETFYKHVAKGIKYPTKAQSENLRGNSIVLFSVVNGKLKDLKIETELGSGCDIEVLNNILSFPNFMSIKKGNYALKTTFELEGANSKISNENADTPVGFTPLKITVVGYKPAITKINNTDKSSVIFPREDKKDKSALYILDNEIVESGILAKIDPKTINTVQILKNADAITKYSEEGKNGVIIITSKSKDSISPIDENKIQNSDIAKTSITIKSNKSKNGIEEALIVLDDVIITEGLSSISPNNVKSIAILKDLSATSLYGEEGKNGVIIITTKKSTDKKEIQKTKQ